MLRVVIPILAVLAIFLIILALLFYIDYRNKKREYELKKYRERGKDENID